MNKLVKKRFLKFRTSKLNHSTVPYKYDLIRTLLDSPTLINRREALDSYSIHSYTTYFINGHINSPYLLRPYFLQ